MNISSRLWILEKQDSKRLLPETLERTRTACYTAGANACDTTVADMKANGWKAIQVRLKEGWHEPIYR
jgi:hypothetical protein